MKKLLLPSAFCLLPYLLSAQDKPYFQQQANYTIHVKLDDTKNELNGDESIEYINNSPDELTFIWFHIWPNAYKNNNTALAKQLIADGNKKFYFAEPNERGWIDGLDFKVDGQAIKTEPHPEHIDIVKLVLNQPLKPGGKITISTPFHVHIPIGVFSRLGHIEQQYQVTQWYPKPAVYDKHGWHEMPYLNQGEFYSEWGNFDVFITVPKNYVVGATGDYVNGDEEIAWLNKKAEETKAMEKFPSDNKFPPSSSEWKTLHLHQEKVHDFAWFADKRYYVVKDEIELPYTKRKVTTWGMFTGSEGKKNSKDLWNKSAKYVADAVYYYSLWNGEYPYNHATAVDGALSAGGGMEYPNITVIGEMGDARSLDRVIAHEVGHNWFYGILGSNERDHGWMDEGVNTFNESRYMAVKYPPDSVKAGTQGNIGGLPINIGKIIGVPDLDESTLMDLGYRFNAARKEDQPCDLPSKEFTQINYGVVMYGKTGMILEYLQAYLGTELYDKCAQAYFEKWKFKHPYPEDMKKVYEEVSGKDLSWFFSHMIPTTDQIDYKVISCKKATCANSFTGDCWEVKVKNMGGINSPFPISTIKDGKIVNTTWIDGFGGTKSVTLYTMDFDHVKIDAQNIMPDINRQNNTLKRKGLCKKTEPFNLKMPGVINNPDKTQLFWAPVMGWNNYNKFMLGAAVHNNLLIEKKLEWVFMPMYSFYNKDLAGGASIHYNIHPNKVFQTIRFGVNAERYSYLNEPLRDLNYNKITPDLTLVLKKKHLNSPVKQTIFARQLNAHREKAVSDYSTVPAIFHYDTSVIVINELSYSFDNARKINPYNITLSVQQSLGFIKSSVTANYQLTFRKKNKALDLRFYYGKIGSLGTNDYDGNYYLHSSGTTGMHDYMYDNVFLGRSESDGFLSRQFAEGEGNMKVNTPLGRTRDWLGSLNVNCPLPGKTPFSLFADFTTFSKDSLSTVGKDKQYLLYDIGLHVTIVKNTIDVYIPLLMSSDIKRTFYINNPDLVPISKLDHPDPSPFKRTMRMIRFTFNIHKMNPFELVRNLSL